MINRLVSGSSDGASLVTQFNKLADSANTSLNLSSNVSIAIGTTPAAIAFNMEDKPHITGSLITHDPVTNNSRLVLTGACTVVLTIQPQVTHLTTGTGDVTFWIRKNGTTPIANTSAKYRTNGILSTQVLTIQAFIDCIAGDYIEVMCASSAASEYEMTASLQSGTGATQIPLTPAIILTVDAKPV